MRSARDPAPRTPSLRRIRFGEFRRDSLWLGPALGALAAGVLALILTADPPAFVGRDHLVSTQIDDARTLLGTIAASILTFTGVVFSITLVALQTASSQYSPRVLRSFVRRPITKIALGSFIATFVYSLVVLARLGTLDGGTEKVPAAAVGFAFVMVVFSVFVFVFFVHATVRSMRVTYIIEAVAHETVHSLISIELTEAGRAGLATGEPSGPFRTLSFAHRGYVLDGLDVARLVSLARRHDATIVLRVEVGTYLTRGEPLADVYGPGREALRSEDVVRELDFAPVRTLYQDARYGVRQLVDIAIRALSPAVNDPTTAVQALDRLHDILHLAAGYPDPPGRHADDTGALRLVRPVASWSRLLDLALVEIIRYGHDSPQVARKLMAVFASLSAAVDDDRAELIEVHRGVLRRAVARHTDDESVQRRDLTADPLGLG